MGKVVGVNVSGKRVGQYHPRAVLTDHDVDVMRRMHEVELVSYSVLVRIFEVPKSTVADICQYRTRCQVPERFKKVS